jgi:hypothetical protein
LCRQAPRYTRARGEINISLLALYQQQKTVLIVLRNSQALLKTAVLEL